MPNDHASPHTRPTAPGHRPPRHLLPKAVRRRLPRAFTRHRLRDWQVTVIVAAAILGGVVGLGVAGLHELVKLVQELAFGLPEGAHLGEPLPIEAWRAVLVPVLGGLLLGLVRIPLRRWRPGEIVDPIEANALYGGKMSLLDSLRLAFTTFLSNAGGASVGMEAAYSQAGAGMASTVGQGLRLRRADLRVLVGAGAAAAIAVAYNAPLAGAFYAFELVLGGYTLAALAPVGAATVTGILAARSVGGLPSMVTVTHDVPVNGWDFVAFAVVGVCAGLLAILTMRAVTFAERRFRAVPVPGWARPALGGLVVGLLALLMPQVLGSGPGAIPLDPRGEVLALLLLLGAKIAASAVSIGSGFRGGLFSASLFLGSIFGALVAVLAARYTPMFELDGIALVLVGMSSVAAAVIGAPVTMVLLVLEATNDLDATLGVLIGVVLSTMVVRQLFGYSFATWRFHLKGVPIRGAFDVGWVDELTVARVMREDAELVREDLPLEELRRRHPLDGTTRTLFAVDAEGRYVGTIDLAAAQDPALDADAAGMLARDLVQEGRTVLLPGDPLRTALKHFRDSESEALPVMGGKDDRHIVGYLTEAYALRRYTLELERRHCEDLGERDLFGPR